MTVYVITNLKNGKRYVGMTTQLMSERWRRHLSKVRSGSKQRIHNAIRRFGAESFTIKSVAFADSMAELRKLEQFYIDQFRCCGTRCGYNATPPSKQMKHVDKLLGKLKGEKG